MKNKPTICVNYSNIWKIFIFLILLFNNETLANNLCSFVYQPTKYVAAGLVAWYIFTSLYNSSFRKMDAGLFLSIAFLCICALFAYFKDSEANGYVLLLLAVITSFSIASSVDIRDFSVFFVDCITFLAGYSLICTYVIKPLMPSFSPLVKVVSNSAGIKFYDAFFCYVYAANDYYRNYGIFREPGVFAYFLCIAIVFLILNKSNVNNYKIILIILIATLISTFSTTGYVAFAIIVAWLAFGRRELDFKIAIPIIFGILAFSFFSFAYIENPFDKLNTNSSSYQYRMESISTALNLIVDKPLGYGINQGLMAMQSNYKLAVYHNTNTWTTLGCYFGVPFMICTLAGVLKFCKEVFNSYLITISIILLLSSEMLIYNPFFYILVFYGLKGLKKNKAG